MSMNFLSQMGNALGMCETKHKIQMKKKYYWGRYGLLPRMLRIKWAYCDKASSAQLPDLNVALNSKIKTKIKLQFPQLWVSEIYLLYTEYQNPIWSLQHNYLAEKTKPTNLTKAKTKPTKCFKTLWTILYFSKLGLHCQHAKL